MLPTWCPDGAWTRMAQSDAHMAPEHGNLGTVCRGGRTHSRQEPWTSSHALTAKATRWVCSASQPLPGAQGAPPVLLQRVLGRGLTGRVSPGLVAGDRPHTHARGTETSHPQVAVVSREHRGRSPCLSGRPGRCQAAAAPARKAGRSWCDSPSSNALREGATERPRRVAAAGSQAAQP